MNSTEKTSSATSMETFTPNSFLPLREMFTRVDPEFARVWESHVSTLLGRPHLDRRTRLLVLVGQYTMTGNVAPLEETIEVAISSGLDPAEILEIILQTYVYGGQWPVSRAVEVFEQVIGCHPEAVRELKTGRGDAPARDLEEERNEWSAEDREDARLAGFFDQYGWAAISTGLKLRPGHHINLVDTLDAIDPDFLQNWLDSVYDGMYSRGRLDDRTRILCVVGNTLALGESHQSRRHMRSALRRGATAREVLEVIFQTSAFFGHPHILPMTVDDLVLILDDEGRLSELIPGDRIDDVRRIVAARVARRSGVQEMDTNV